MRWQLAEPRRRAAALRRRAAAPRAEPVSRLVRRAPPAAPTLTRRAARRCSSARSDSLIDDHLAQPAVYVHRDYMPRNLMVADAQSRRPRLPGRGRTARSPTTSSRCSRDAFVSWPEERVLDWHDPLLGAGARAPACRSIADFAAFYRDFEWMGLQRHLKVLGIFARINYRDGKPQLPRRTRRASSRYVRAGRAALSRARRRCARLLDRARGARRRSSATRF
ncbi:MAG: hypothetical protein MZW92_11455 [Comamonadaceae bacterium]|nr:hypothetical protein [Comamonadaceae bacterium]